MSAEWVKTAKVGDKVVAVGRGWNEGSINVDQQRRIGAARPNIGTAYTIKSIHDWGGDRILINFMELDNSHLLGKIGGAIEPGWHYSHFRPVHPRKTEISVFTDILNKATTPIKEEA